VQNPDNSYGACRMTGRSKAAERTPAFSLRTAPPDAAPYTRSGMKHN